MNVLNCLECGSRLHQPVGRGRRRLYCSDRCRKKAHRLRAERAAYTVLAADHGAPEPELDLGAAEGDVLNLPAEPLAAVQVTVMEAWCTVRRLARCAERLGSNPLGFHCSETAAELEALLRRHFKPQTK